MKEKYYKELLGIQKEYKNLNLSIDELPPKFYEDYARVLDYHRRRYEKLLSRAVAIEEYISEELINTRSKIKMEQLKGNKVAVVCLTGDLAHPGHIAYIKTAREKIKDKFGFKDEEIKLFVGLETSERTKKRKGKEPILGDEERKYQWQHIKGVDEVFIWDIDEDLYPSDLMLYLQPNFWISHEEHFDRFGKYLRVSRKLKHGTYGRTKVIIVGYEDKDKYLPEGDVRKKWKLSTSDIVKRVLEKQREFIAKNYPEKIVEILTKIDFSSLNNK